MKRTSILSRSLVDYPLVWQVFRDSAIATFTFLVVVCLLFV